MMEKRFLQITIDKLESLGHKVTYVEEWSQIMGHDKAIMIDSVNEVLTGGAAPRGDSAAVSL